MSPLFVQARDGLAGHERVSILQEDGPQLGVAGPASGEARLPLATLPGGLPEPQEAAVSYWRRRASRTTDGCARDLAPPRADLGRAVEDTDGTDRTEVDAVFRRFGIEGIR